MFFKWNYVRLNYALKIYEPGNKLSFFFYRTETFKVSKSYQGYNNILRNYVYKIEIFYSICWRYYANYTHDDCTYRASIRKSCVKIARYEIIPRDMSHFFVSSFHFFPRRCKKRERERGSERKIYRRRLRRNQSVDSRNRKVNVEKRKEGKGWSSIISASMQMLVAFDQQSFAACVSLTQYITKSAW